MEDDQLTSKAIAELMREFGGPDTTVTSYGVQERKINPLGKANKRFLGRTINTVMNHNKRHIERTHAKSRLKLQDLDDRYEKRKTNAYYNGRRNAARGERKTSRSRSRHKSRRRTRSSSESRQSSSRSRSRSRSRKHKRKHRRHKKSKQRHRSRSSEHKQSRNDEQPVNYHDEVLDYYTQHSKNMALAVAMAYNPALYAQSCAMKNVGLTTENTTKSNKKATASPSSDILRELMSDDDGDVKELDALSIHSTGSEKEVLTIDVSSNSGTDTEQESAAEISESESCISLDDSADEEALGKQSEIKCDALPKQESSTTIDLTED